MIANDPFFAPSPGWYQPAFLDFEPAQFGLTQVAAPEQEPVDLYRARKFCSIPADETTWDTLIEDLISGAREDAERVTMRSLINQTWKLTLDAFPVDNVIRLKRGPVTAVTLVRYYDSTGTWQTVSSANYTTDLTRDVARIMPVVGKTWASPKNQIGVVEVTYTAGYGSTWTQIPAGLRVAMQTAIAYRFENRGGVLDQAYIDSLFAPFTTGEYT